VSYLVLARKWRPQTFSDLIGQEHVSQTLQNAIESGRVAHAFLFTGARGVGKTSSARILAKTLNCEQGPTTEPCNVCPACTEITAGNAVDVFEIDGASNTSVDDVRELRENIKYLPSRCRYKIFIIDEVHMLSTSAFNALLKTLEEPPPHVKFIFATTEPHKVPITILSRCQRFDFKRIPLQMTVARLRYIVDQERVTISDGALAMIARKGDGSMRDSLSTLDQVLAFCGDRVRDEDVVTLLGVVDLRLLHEASRAVFARDCRAALDVVRQVDAVGYSMRHFCQELIDHFRNLTVMKAVGDTAGLMDLAAGELAEIEATAAAADLADLQRHVAILLKAESDMAHATFPRLLLEMALLRMANLAPVVPVDEILERLRSLEGKGGGGMVASATPAWGMSRPPADSHPQPKTTRSATVPAPPAPRSPRSETLQEVLEHNSSDGVAEADPWPRFVAFVKEKKASIGSFLEHGRPLKVSSSSLEIGFTPEQSYYLNTLREPDYGAVLKELACTFFRGEPGIRLIPLPGTSEATPPSLAEKKSLEDAAKRETLRQTAETHPLVAAALEIFGGAVSEIREIDKADD
jgi:DNA polymerase-3 subunit gamma/tau